MIKLIGKNKDTTKLDNFRPIALLCTDYKIMAAVISNRIKETLPLTICEAQIGGVPGRKIFNSLCLYRDLIERINEKNEKIRRLNEDNLCFERRKENSSSLHCS